MYVNCSIEVDPPNFLQYSDVSLVGLVRITLQALSRWCLEEAIAGDT